jgi:ribonuclease R
MANLPTSENVLQVFRQAPSKTFRLRELSEQLNLPSSRVRDLKRALRELAAARKIVRSRNNLFMLSRRMEPEAAPLAPRARRAGTDLPPSRQANRVTGRLSGHRDGFGFVVPDQPVSTGGVDVFIPPGGMGEAMHGDQVEALMVRAKSGGRVEGRIIRVIERAQRTVVGEYHCGSRANYVLPFDHRLTREIVIPAGSERAAAPDSNALASRNRQFGGKSDPRRPMPASGSLPSARELDGLIVDVEITAYPGLGKPAQGRVIEVLGRRDDFGVDVEMIIRKFHLPHRFPAPVLQEAEAAPQFISLAERDGREDFRHLPVVTIDGETAKDFDDAVYVEKLSDSRYLLHVHIADVAHYVQPGSALDREGHLRSTSVYFPDRAVPMLPLELSNGICSLNPHTDRLVMSAIMEIDSLGEIVRSSIVPGVIHSAERMTYTSVFAVLSGDADACRQYAAHVQHFRLMEELARVLIRHRESRGSVDFDLPEAEIEFDAGGQMIGVTRSERNIAHRMIEEFMLAANQTVARYLETRGIPSLYRIHEKPDAQKVLDFEQIAATFGYSLGVELPAAERLRVRLRDEKKRYPRFAERLKQADLKITSRHYQRLSQRLAGKPEERILSYLMLRSLKQARYAEENTGHFALAMPTYTHFTSPIRRYPDLIVHRVLKAALLAEGAGKPAALRQPSPLPGAAFLSRDELRALGSETSEAERRAADAERELMDWKKVQFMAQRLGDEFEALIIGLTKNGFFVELQDLFVEGFVPLESLGFEPYVYRESLRAIVCTASRRAFRIGDRLQVRLDRVDRISNKLQFSVVEPGKKPAEPGRGARPAPRTPDFEP